MEQPKEITPIEISDPSEQPYQYKIFINNCNDYLGSELVETLRNDHIIEANPNIIIGTLNPLDASAPPGDIIQAEFSNKTAYNTFVQFADIIVFDLNQSNLQEFEYLLKVLKYMRLTTHKTVICLSSLLSWNQTPLQDLRSSASDLAIRKSQYTYLKQLENMCLNINQENDRVNGYVICTGVIYGLGEKTLFPYFKQAVLQNPEQLAVIGDGRNFIPMVHIKDLCSLVQQVAFNKPEKNYYLFSDEAKVTQYELIQKISASMGNGRVKTHSIEDFSCNLDFHMMTLNFKFSESCSSLIPNWHSKAGFVANITQVVSEFNLYRGIKANKIFVHGLPLSGKSTVAEALAKHYNLPLLRIKETIEYVKSQPGELGEQIMKTLDSIKAKMVEDEQKLFEQAKKKKKAKKGQPVEEFNPDKCIPRLPDAYVIRIYKWRLSQPDCQNKGYVLDDWPKTYQQAQQLFLNEGGHVDTTSLPNSFFCIKASEQQIKDRLKKLPAEKTSGTHWTEEATIRRLQTYKKNNQSKTVTKFFTEHQVDGNELSVDWSDKNILVSFIERNGPIGLTPADPLPHHSSRADPAEKQEETAKTVIENKSCDQEEPPENEKKLLDEKSKPIRQYLIDNVIPHLTEGLIQVCKQLPKDPLDFLINFLETKQHKLEEQEEQ